MVVAVSDMAWPVCCRVIAKGQIAEQGTHESLAEAGGLYSGLVRSRCPRHLLPVIARKEGAGFLMVAPYDIIAAQ